jgi:D-xylulose reductase
LVTDSTEQNEAFVLRGPLDVSFEDRPVPKITDPYSVLIRVDYTGICGSDVHYWCDGKLGPFVLESPMVLGHESAGTVIQVGAKVQLLQQGDRVAMEPGVPCRRCDRCKEGNYNLCLDMAFAATPPYDGTLATYYVLPEDFCYKLPENVSLEEGSMLEPLSVAVHILRQSNIKHGDTVVVFGAGPIGLLCCAVAKAYGARKIIAVDIQHQRLEFASEFAATATYRPSSGSPEENAQALKKEHNLGTGADVALDASGAEVSVQTAIHVLRHGGSYVQGGLGHEQVHFPIAGACTKELTIRGSFRYSAGDYQTALNLVEAGKVDVKRLITSKVSFKEAESAFQAVKAGKEIKVLIAGSQPSHNSD